MDRFDIYVDKTNYIIKPTPFETRFITKSIMENPRRLTLKDLVDELEKGCSVMLSELSTNDIKGNFVSQQLFFLDIDNKSEKFLFSDAIKDPFILENACFIYRTFNDNAENNRFRIAFALDTPVKTKKDSLDIYEALMLKFPSADKATKNHNRIFFGTNTSVHIVNLDNRLNSKQVISETLPLDILEAMSILEESDMESIETIPTWVLIKLGADEYLKNRLRKYGRTLADISQFSEYFKRIDIGEFLELPVSNTFNDIFHDETNPSAGVFSLASGIQLYKCHSSKNPFVGDLIRVVARLKNCGIVTALNYLISITGSSEEISEELKELRDSIDILKNILLAEDLKEQYPELDKYVANYRTDMVAILEILKTSTYWDLDMKEYRALFYYSTKTLSKKLGYDENPKNQKRIQRVLNLMTYMMFIDKLTAEESPKLLLKKLEKSRKEKAYTRRVNIIEAKKFTDDSFEVIFEQCKKMFNDGFTIGGFNREYLLRNESIFVADRVFPQEHKRLQEVDTKYDSLVAKYIFKELEERKYVLERDVRDAFCKIIGSRVVSDTKWKTIRKDLMNAYDLKRVRLNKELKQKYRVEGLSETSSPYILIDNKN